MAVGRRFKKGTRAGGKKSRPASRNGRVRVHAYMRNITKEEKPNVYRGEWKSSEEMVIHWATEAVGKRAGKGFVQADDLVSDIILELLDAGGFSWPEDDIKDFCRKRSQWMVERYKGRREISECQMFKENNSIDAIGDEGEFGALAAVSGTYPPRQHLEAYASQMKACLDALPDQQRRALLILCDGGNPVEVAEELEVTPWLAITIIKEGRRYIHEVEPDWRDWR